MRAFLLSLLSALSLYGETIEIAPLKVSSESISMIIYYETGGEAYYNSKLKKITVPPGASGCTIGFGYDLGYNTKDQIRNDWKGVIPDAQIERLVTVAGLKGSSAKAALSRVKDITISWEAAKAVYEKKSMPRFAKLTGSTYKGIENLHPHIQGVMLSTTFNRGSAMTPYDRRKELVWSRDDIKLGNTASLPDYQLQMRRLWPSIEGLRKRYSAHAGLMQKALDNP